MNWFEEFLLAVKILYNTKNLFEAQYMTTEVLKKHSITQEVYGSHCLIWRQQTHARKAAPIVYQYYVYPAKASFSWNNVYVICVHVMCSQAKQQFWKVCIEQQSVQLRVRDITLYRNQ